MSFLGSVVETISNVVSTVDKMNQQRKRDNEAVIEKAKTIDMIAKGILVFSVATAVLEIAFTPAAAILPILFCCLPVAYAAYEVSTIASNVKNHIQDSWLVWWNPEESFIENLHLDKLSAESRIHKINEMTKGAPVTGLAMRFWYR